MNHQINERREYIMNKLQLNDIVIINLIELRLNDRNEYTYLSTSFN